ncbi:hypothetical protein OH491_15580 [Termitidicoccus mucosus]|uniref:Uncharacterized protein n=1 Tax=Termitidicoccus mucosus TaxID=1184151 RepID=A0A178IID2_9BACT|nr:hypothetical protein AW736_12960 [Opitutaceae bacterium TSB47]
MQGLRSYSSGGGDTKTRQPVTQASCLPSLGCGAKRGFYFLEKKGKASALRAAFFDGRQGCPRYELCRAAGATTMGKTL